MLRFGTQTDTQAINGGPSGELTPERVAAYIAKYATKSADDFGIGDRRISLDALPLLDVSQHVERIVRTCWTLGDHPGYEVLRRWLHMLGFRGDRTRPVAWPAGPACVGRVRGPALGRRRHGGRVWCGPRTTERDAVAHVVTRAADALGHEQTSTTLDRYTHPSRDRETRARSVFADFPLTPPAPSDPGNESGAPERCP